MSTDPLALVAIQRCTSDDTLVYFEAAEISSGYDQSDPRRTFVAIGRKSLHLVARSLQPWLGTKRDVPSHIPYTSIARVVEDASSIGVLVLHLKDTSDPFWRPFQVTLSGFQHRTRFLMHLRAAWETDDLLKLGVVRELPVTSEAISHDSWSRALPPQILPFKGYKRCVLDGYSFFMRNSFSSAGARMHSSSSAVHTDVRGLTLKVQIQEPRALDTLYLDDSEHIRWVAIRQRQSVLEELTGVLIVRNGFYLKKMNLANDLSSWTGWEVFLKSDTLVMVMISLRRKYVPPLADSVQDIFLTLSCPKHVLDERAVTDDEMLMEARLAADSFSPLVNRYAEPQRLYHDYLEMIQAKLDALLFGEDAMPWLKASLGLEPEPKLLAWAKSFVKSILKILNEESVLQSPSLLKALGEETATEKDPMVFPYRMVNYRCPGHGVDESQAAIGGPGGGGRNPLECTDEAANAFLSRVSKYLTYCLDGGILGPRFALTDLTSPWIPTPRSQAKIDEVVGFLLHIRPKDWRKPFVNKQIRLLLPDPNIFQHNTFNDRVMQSLVELGWIEKAIMRHAPKSDHGGAGNDDKHISFGYARFLARLIMSEGASINLKASVCRQLGGASNASEHFGELCGALLKTCAHSSVFLRTNTTIALITMCAEEDFVKDKLMESGILVRCIKNIRSGDDDLTRYTLVLLTHLTKDAATLPLMGKEVRENLLMLLEKTPSLESKQSLLAELASVLGQLCNNDEIWKTMVEDPMKPVDKLIALYKSDASNLRLRSKVIFALRKFCDRRTDLPQARKENIAKIHKEVIDHLEKLFPAQALDKSSSMVLDADSTDFAVNAVMLLSTLCKSAKVMHEYFAGIHDLLLRMSQTQLGALDSTREKLHWLKERIPMAKTSEAGS